MLAGGVEVKTCCYRVTVEVLAAIRKYFRNKVKQAQSKKLGEEGCQKSVQRLCSSLENWKECEHCSQMQSHSKRSQNRF